MYLKLWILKTSTTLIQSGAGFRMTKTAIQVPQIVSLRFRNLIL